MKLLSTAFAALALSASVAALSAPALADSAIMTASHAMRVSKLVGTPVYNAQSEKIGTVAEVLVPASGAAPSAVISVGDYVGGGDKMVVVPLSRVKFHGDAMTLAVTKAQLASMQAFTFRMAADSAG